MNLRQMILVAALGTSILCGCGSGAGAGTASNANGGGSQPSAVQGGSVGSAGPGSAVLSWLPPTTDTDGQPLTDLSGYVVYYGTSANALDQVIQVSTAGISSYVVDNLQAGTWYFALRAVTSDGTESALSSIVSKTIG